MAILDTGIDPTHPDLNVVGGVDCTGGNDWTDHYGHGTHVSGIVGALDNGYGVVGVAPGVRLWAVKVIDDDGYLQPDYIECGLKWIGDHSGTIDVVNASLRFNDCTAYWPFGMSGMGDPVWEFGSTQAECDAGLARERDALLRLLDDGKILFVVSAGNEFGAIRLLPASDPGVVSVGALADYDGQAGGWGLAPSVDASECATGDPDDSVAEFSNSGENVLAPGVCILSTVPGGYEYHSGTSMASPYVSGVAALLKERNPNLNAVDAEIALTLSSTEEIEGVKVLDTLAALDYTGPTSERLPRVTFGDIDN